MLQFIIKRFITGNKKNRDERHIIARLCFLEDKPNISL